MASGEKLLRFRYSVSALHVGTEHLGIWRICFRDEQVEVQTVRGLSSTLDANPASDIFKQGRAK